MAWHPVGHVLATGSNDLMTRFWTQPKAEEGRGGAVDPQESAIPEGVRSGCHLTLKMISEKMFVMKAHEQLFLRGCATSASDASAVANPRLGSAASKTAIVLGAAARYFEGRSSIWRCQ